MSFSRARHGKCRMHVSGITLFNGRHIVFDSDALMKTYELLDAGYGIVTLTDSSMPQRAVSIHADTTITLSLHGVPMTADMLRAFGVPPFLSDVQELMKAYPRSAASHAPA